MLKLIRFFNFREYFETFSRDFLLILTVKRNDIALRYHSSR